MRIFTRLFIALLLSIGSAYADILKAVYDLTTGESKKIEKNLIDSIEAVAKHYQKEQKELKVMVVISGNAYKYFVNDLKASPYREDKDAIEAQEKFRHRLQNLNDTYGVIFNMCSAGMKARKIDRNTLYKYVHADAMKSVYLIEAQNDGYAYLPVH
ncbi:MAG TPA: DsrE family protein [Sulfurovum sp.]|nr:DsrE family protein [Sulfurovum sp.]